MRKNTLAFLTFFICLVGFKTPQVSADVLGTSVIVEEAVEEINIKKIDTEIVGGGGNLSSNISVSNLGENRKTINRVVVTVSGLDGTVVQTESVEVVKSLLPSENSDFEVEFPSKLEEGDYIGLFKFYSDNDFLGESKTIISIPRANPQVLGTMASQSTNVLLLTLGGSFAFLLLVNIILLVKRPSWLNKKINFGFEDIVFLISGLSAFGTGFCGGYMFTEKYLSSVFIQF